MCDLIDRTQQGAAERRRGGIEERRGEKEMGIHTEEKIKGEGLGLIEKEEEEADGER